MCCFLIHIVDSLSYSVVSQITIYMLPFLFCSYLLVLDRTNWKTNILTALLVPYIFFSLPSLVFNLLRWQSILCDVLTVAIPFFVLLINICVTQGRNRKMDCFCCRGIASLFSSTFSWYDVSFNLLFSLGLLLGNHLIVMNLRSGVRIYLISWLLWNH